ncbi:helix-turn-helix domain-containing protein [Escherichia coli]|nr:helix-turn-helix domain-containing protein [Escherichia coli]
MTQPAPDEIRAAREAAGLTQSAAAALVHANLRSWQKWEAGERAMHPAFWELFLIKTNRLHTQSKGQIHPLPHDQ